MPPRQDDQGITNAQFLLRALKSKWVIKRENRERATSDSLTDSNYENSCFVEEEFSLEEMRRLFPGHRIVRIPVQVVRDAGFVLERRPDEAPEECSIPNSHIVIGPIERLRRIEYESAARRIVKHLDTEILSE